MGRNQGGFPVFPQSGMTSEPIDIEYRSTDRQDTGMLTKEMSSSFIGYEPKGTSVDGRSIRPASVAYLCRDLQIRSTVRGYN